MSDTVTSEQDEVIPDDVLLAALSRPRSPLDVGPLGDAPSAEAGAEETPPAAADADTQDDEEPEDDEEGAASDDAAGEADGDSETPSADAEASADTDPFEALLKAGQPLTYKVDGQEKAFDGIVEVAGKGAVIPQAHLNTVRDRLQQAEHATAKNRELYAETQRFKALGGEEKFRQMEVTYAKLNAASQVFAEMLEDPTKMAALFVVNPDGTLALNQDRYDLTLNRLKLAAERAELEAGRTLGERVTQFERAAAEPDERQATLTHAITMLGEGLPTEDVEAAKTFFAQFGDALFRAATPEDVKQWPGRFQVGQMILDTPRMAAWFQDRKAVRAQLAQASEAKAKAARENAKRVTPVAKPAAPKVTKPKGQPRDDEGRFAKPKRTLADLQLAALRGEEFDDDE